MAKPSLGARNKTRSEWLIHISHSRQAALERRDLPKRYRRAKKTSTASGGMQLSGRRDGKAIAWSPQQNTF